MVRNGTKSVVSSCWRRSRCRPMPHLKATFMSPRERCQVRPDKSPSQISPSATSPVPSNNLSNNQSKSENLLCTFVSMRAWKPMHFLQSYQNSLTISNLTYDPLPSYHPRPSPSWRSRWWWLLQRRRRIPLPTDGRSRQQLHSETILTVNESRVQCGEQHQLRGQTRGIHRSGFGASR